MILIYSIQCKWKNLTLFVFCFVRCKVPECDVGENNRDIPYNQKWVNFAIPTASNGKLKNCVRYASLDSNDGSIQCAADKFNISEEIECTEYIYETNEKNMQTEVLPLRNVKSVQF